MVCRKLDVRILSDFCVSGRRNGVLKILNPGQGARWEGGGAGALWGSPFSQKQESDKKEFKVQYFL